MRKSKLLVGLAASVLLTGAAAAQQSAEGEEWPAFDQIDRDSDGVLTQEEMQDVSGLQEQIDEDQITRQEYEELQQQEQGSTDAAGSAGEDPTLVPPETSDDASQEGMQGDQMEQRETEMESEVETENEGAASGSEDPTLVPPETMEELPEEGQEGEQ